MSLGISTSILHNLTAQQTANQLAINQSDLSKTIDQLSTGLRINSPADDAAGNAIANRLNANLAILNQGTLNAQDGVSVLQVAQGGLGQIQSLLNQMSSLATEASNAALNQTEVADIQTQINSLLNQINQVVNETAFGNQLLLNGSIQGPSTTVNATVNIASNGVIGAAGNSLVSGFTIGSAALALGNTLTSDEVFQIVVTPQANCSDAVDVTVNSNLQGSIANVSVALLNGPSAGAISLAFGTNNGVKIYATLNFSNLTSFDVPNIINQQSYIAAQALQAAVTQNNGLQIQVGSTLGQVATVSAPDASTGTLFNGQSINVTTALGAQGALNQIAHALSIVTTEESTLAAAQGQMNDQVNENNVLSENMTASVSRITDLNVAQATTTLTQQEILVQTATSMLSQANLAPQSILKLFP